MAKNSLNWQNDSVIKAYQQVREKDVGRVYCRPAYEKRSPRAGFAHK